MEEGDGGWTRERVISALVMTLSLTAVLGAVVMLRG